MSWIELKGSPDIKKDKNGLTVTQEFEAPWDEVFDDALLPDPGVTVCPVETVPEFEKLICENLSIKNTDSGRRARISILYKEQVPGMGGAADRKNYETVYTLSDGGLEKPIETHPEYITCWNYILVGKIGKEVPDWWEAAVNPMLSTTDYKWIKETSELPEGFAFLCMKKKPGVESYKTAAPVIEERKYFNSERKSEISVKYMNKLKVPGETFGLPAASKNWLIMSVSIQPDGKYWCVTTSYQYADEWDTDIYPVA